MTQMLLDEILIGDRVRKDMGDLQGLANSMKRHGLLHPIVVKKNNMLVAGHRRIEAARLIGWKEIDVTVIDVADLLSAERDENTERKDFTPTEAVAIGRLIEEQHRAKIEAAAPEKNRRIALLREAGKRGEDTKTLKQELGAHPLGASGNVASRAVGMGPSKYTQAKAVVSAAEADPVRFGDLPARMDETGNVAGAHRELERRRTGNGRNPALRRMAHLKPNREVERAVASLDGICHVLKEVPIAQLEKDKRPGWARSIKKFASDLNRFARRLNG